MYRTRLREPLDNPVIWQPFFAGKKAGNTGTLLAVYLLWASKHASNEETRMGRKLHDSEKDVKKREDRDANRDPITGTAGSHPVGVGVGAVVGGAATGAAVGSIAGPAGALVGAAVGAVAGGLVGKGAAEALDPTVEEAYWKEHYATEPYYKLGRTYKDYAAAYRAGYEGRTRHHARTFEEVERDLEMEYNKRRAENGPLWEEGRAPARAAWDRVERIIPSEAGHGHGKS